MRAGRKGKRRLESDLGVGRAVGRGDRDAGGAVEGGEAGAARVDWNEEETVGVSLHVTKG